MICEYQIGELMCECLLVRVALVSKPLYEEKVKIIYKQMDKKGSVPISGHSNNRIGQSSP